MALGSFHRKAASCDVRKQTNLHNPPSCEKWKKYSLFSLTNMHWKTKSVDTIRFYLASAILVILVQTYHFFHTSQIYPNRHFFSKFAKFYRIAAFTIEQYFLASFASLAPACSLFAKFTKFS